MIAADPLTVYPGAGGLRGVGAAPAAPGETWTTLRLHTKEIQRDEGWARVAELVGV